MPCPKNWSVRVALTLALILGNSAQAQGDRSRPGELEEGAVSTGSSRGQNLPRLSAGPGTAGPAYPRRRPGLWEIRSSATEAVDLPPSTFCIGKDTDNVAVNLDRVPGTEGSCSIGPFRRVGDTWVAETVCREPEQTVISQSVASGDFQASYRIDTLVFYSPPLADNKREDKEAITGRYLGACKRGQRAGDLEVPGMGTLNMNDGSLKTTE